MGPNLQISLRSGAASKRHHLLLSSAHSLSDEALRSKKSRRDEIVITADNLSTRAVSVKDLRSRRIFSPAKVDGGVICEVGFRDEDRRSSGCVHDSGLAANTKGERDGVVLTAVGIGSDERVGNRGRDSQSRDKSAVKSSLRRKVFKVRGSHSYSRMLPFLIDMAKNDAHSFTVSSFIPKSEKLGLGPQNSKDENKSDHSVGLKALENEETKNCGAELSREAQNSNELNILETLGDTRSHEDLKGNENVLSSNGVDESTEEHIDSEIDKIGSGFSSNSPDSNGTNPKFSSLVYSSDLKYKDEGSDGLELLENENIKNLNALLSCEALDMDQLNLSGSEEGIRLDHKDQKRNENDGNSNGLDDTTEEHNVPNVDEIDLGISSDSLNSDGTNPKLSFLVNSNDPEGEDEGLDCFKPLDNGNIKNSAILLFREALDMDRLNLSGSEKCIQLDDKDQKRNENGGGSNGVDEYTEEHILTTPPDMNIFSNSGMSMVENVETPKEKIAIENGSIARGDAEKDIYSKNGSTFKRNVVLNPCSRRKIFKTPGSFSYRRLLPYLMDVSNDNLYNFLDGSKYPRHPKVETDTEEKKTSKLLPMVELKNQDTPIDKSETRHPGGDMWLNPATAIQISNANSSDNKLTFESAEMSIELQKPFDSPNKYVLPVEQVISDVLKDLEHASVADDSEIEMTSPTIVSCSSGDDGTTHRDDGKCKSSHGTKALDLECLNQKSSQGEESCPFDNPDHSKGILRRNPRGCRGLCTCLNCTSFRLNAERAFEFSRNQMLDAEEVALDLIKELSGLRNMLKESTGNPHIQVTADIDQIMAACTKALNAEESAKYRLREMQSDLSVHCRSKFLERPRVRFANHNKEMVIAQVDLPASNRRSTE